MGIVDRIFNAVEILFENSTNGFTSTDVQAAIEEAKATAEGKVRFAISLVNNSTLSNNQIVRRNELVGNTPVILPRACTLREVTFSNSSANADWKFQFYRVVGAVETLLFDWQQADKQTDYLGGLDHDFAAGDEIRIYFRDVGNNPSDSVIDLYFQVT